MQRRLRGELPASFSLLILLSTANQWALTATTAFAGLGEGIPKQRLLVGCQVEHHGDEHIGRNSVHRVLRVVPAPGPRRPELPKENR